MLLPVERPRVDAAGSGCFAVVHRDSIPDAVRIVRERPVDAVLVSVHRCGPEQVEVLGHLVREFPGIPTVALVSQHDPTSTEMLLRLGASGVRQVVDVTSPMGWSRLRQVVGQPATRAVARIQGPILEALAEAPADTRLFIEAIIRLAPDTPTVTTLAQRLYVRPSTLMSRFSRAGLPSPKNYLAALRLAPRGLSLRGRRALRCRRVLPAGILLAPELRTPSPGHAGCHRPGVPPEISLSRWP